MTTGILERCRVDRTEFILTHSSGIAHARASRPSSPRLRWYWRQPAAGGQLRHPVRRDGHGGGLPLSVINRRHLASGVSKLCEHIVAGRAWTSAFMIALPKPTTSTGSHPLRRVPQGLRWPE